MLLIDLPRLTYHEFQYTDCNIIMFVDWFLLFHSISYVYCVFVSALGLILNPLRSYRVIRCECFKKHVDSHNRRKGGSISSQIYHSWNLSEAHSEGG